MPPDPDHKKPHNTLYVFFHGLCSFIETRKGVDALLPFMPEHSYRAGEFLGETLLLERADCDPYKLKGANGGKGGFGKKENLILKGTPKCKSRLLPHEIHCRISLPRPIKIHPFRSVDLSKSLSDPGIFSNTIVSLLQVFEYSFDNSKKIQLGDHRGTRDSPVVIGKDSYVSLHIFSEEDFALGDKDPHTSDGFSASLRLFPGVADRCRLTGQPDIPAINPKKILPGTVLPEYEDLHFRTEDRLALLGRAIRRNQWPKSWDDGGPPFGDSIGSCTNVVSSDL